MEKREGLIAFVSNLGKVQSRAGMRGALDGLKIAEHPKDVAKLATLAAVKGTKTRAIVKLLGRGAIVLDRLAVHARIVDVLGAVQPAGVLRGVQAHGGAHDLAPLRAAADAAARKRALGSGGRGCLNGGVFNAARIMPTFKHENVEIAYLDEGEGDPIVLVHGFASNKEVNWVQPGWISTLTRDNRRVIALDNRGHGQSTKLYDPADYHTDMMAADVAALIAHLGLDARRRDGLFARRAHLRGAGGAPSGRGALADPGRRRHQAGRSAGLRDEIARPLEAPSLDDVTDPMGKAFRAFAEQTNSDLSALAACLRGSRQARAASRTSQAIRAPALVAAGTKDDIAGSPHELAALLPNGRRRSTSRTAITWLRSATKCSNPACSNSCNERAVKHLQPATAMFNGAAGNRLVADVYGDAGQPVLLLHGGGQTRHAWRRTAEHLARAGALPMRSTSAAMATGMGRGRALCVRGLCRRRGRGRTHACPSAAGKLPIAIGASLGGISSLLAEGDGGAGRDRAAVRRDRAGRHHAARRSRRRRQDPGLHARARRRRASRRSPKPPTRSPPICRIASARARMRG